MMRFIGKSIFLLASLCSAQAFDEIPVPLPADSSCESRTSCSSCLALAGGNTCVWAAESCQSSCNVIADATCYGMETFPTKSEDEICEAAANARLDDQLCAQQEGCFTCVAAIKSDGSSCQYYIDETTKMGYCGSGGCDFMGNCPVESCTALLNNAAEQEIPEIPVPLPVDYNCESRSSCSTCLAAGSTCAWVAGSCQESCSTIADAACYTLGTFPNKSGGEICEVVAEADINHDLCQGADNCHDCTSSYLLDGENHCSWYSDGQRGWCGAQGGCDMNGICGSSNYDACPATRRLRGNVRGASSN